MSDGRTAKRLRRLLEAQGFEVFRLTAATGNDRTDHRADVFRWDGHARRDGQNVNLSSWDTMTSCVRNGIVAKREDGAHYDIAARSPR